MSDRLLQIDQLCVHIGDQPVIENLSLDLKRGETLVLAGESGSGKSLTALSVARLLPAAAQVRAGRITLGDTALFGLAEREMTKVRVWLHWKFQFLI
jgi:peptide/nickel transport system ATP-binding protein